MIIRITIIKRRRRKNKIKELKGVPRMPESNKTTYGKINKIERFNPT